MNEVLPNLYSALFYLIRLSSILFATRVQK